MTGGYLHLANGGPCVVWFGLSGVLNDRVMPGETRHVNLAIARARNDRRPTQQTVYARFCTGSVAPQTPAPTADNGNSCPPNMLFRSDNNNPRCECRSMFRWDSAGNRCVPDTCTGGRRWDTVQNSCACAAGREYSERRRRCIEANCATGTTFDRTTDRCTCPPATPSWNGARRQCQACAASQHWVAAQNRCESCVGGQQWNGSECEDRTPATNANRPATCAPACTAAQTCVQGVCVGTGALRITLTWSQAGDMDLHVRTPSGSVISYRNRSADGGQLDRDDTAGTGPENVFWTAAPPPGAYAICVDPYGVRSPTNYSVAVVLGSAVQTFTGSRSGTERGACSTSSPNFVTEINVGGTRAQQRPAQQPTPPGAAPAVSNSPAPLGECAMLGLPPANTNYFRALCNPNRCLVYPEAAFTNLPAGCERNGGTGASNGTVILCCH